VAPPGVELTSPYSWRNGWDKARQYMRELAVESPRDSKGRFLKG